MRIGYATIMYDSEAVVSEGIGDFAACRYDGVEIGLAKAEAIGEAKLRELLNEYDLDLYCVMAGWLNSEEDLQAAVDGAELAGSLGQTSSGSCRRLGASSMTTRSPIGSTKSEPPGRRPASHRSFIITSAHTSNSPRKSAGGWIRDQTT